MKSIRHAFIYRFDPCHEFLKQAIRTAFSTFLALVLFHIFHDYPERYWMVLSAAFIMQTRVGKSFLFKNISLIVCGLLASMTAFVMALLQTWMIPAAIVLGLFGAFYVAFSAKGHFAIIRSFFVFLFAIMSMGLPIMPGGSSWQRVCFVLLGVVCTLVAGFLWPDNRQKFLKRLFSVYEHNLAEFIFLELNMLIQQAINESTLHERRNRLLRQFRELKQYIPSYDKRLSYLENLRGFAIEVGNVRLLHNSEEQIIIASELLDKLYAPLQPILKIKIKKAKESSQPLTEHLSAKLLFNRFNEIFEQRSVL